jgi:hypothetical protein
MNKIIKITVFLVITVLVSTQLLNATVDTVTVTSITPASVIGGVNYYLAGQSYTFRVQATSSTNTLKSDWNSIKLDIDSTNALIDTITISVDTDTPTASTGLNFIGLMDNSFYATGNLDYNITVMFLWTATEIGNAARSVRATVTDDIAPAPNSLTNTSLAANFGICASIQVMNFVQTGAAGDGKITPKHDAFNVTGVLVYNVATATPLDTIPAGNIASVSLLRNAVVTALVNGGVLPSVSFPVPINYFNPGFPGLGTYTWQVRAVMQAAVGGGNEDSSNTIFIRTDRVQITDVRFFPTVSVDLSPNYWKSTNVPGATIRVYAQMERLPTSGNVEGNTVVRIRYNYGAGNIDTDVTILSGAAFGDAAITYPVIGAGTSLLPGAYTTNYTAVEIIGGPYDEPAPYGQHTSGDITGVIRNVTWNNANPPRNNAIGSIFTGAGAHTTTASSLTLLWTALTTVGGVNGDFYSYKVYVKKSSDAIWNVIDRTTDATLGVIGTVTATVIGLVPFTNYDYQLSAVNVFGNETLLADMIKGPPPLLTKPISIAVILSDGITQYPDSSFPAVANPPVNRSLRNTAIKITLDIITAGAIPDQVNLHLGNALITPAGALPVIAANRISCTKTAPNRYVAYIPTTHPFNIVGGEIWFVAELVYGGVSTFVDHDGGANYIDYEWNFLIASAPTFTPWPTRILNNVMDANNPICYPAYYLTDDAYVTISVFDLKGRPVVTLLDNQLRKGGQNIKEGGWDGANKAARKIGVGIYYVRFYATRAADGKVILNEFKKVVMAR